MDPVKKFEEALNESEAEVVIKMGDQVIKGEAVAAVVIIEDAGSERKSALLFGGKINVLMIITMLEEMHELYDAMIQQSQEMIAEEFSKNL